MRLDEIIKRPGNRKDAVNLLLQAGYKMLGQPGAHGVVVQKPGAGYCVKLFSTRDFAYLGYLKMIMTHANPHFPRVKGRLIGIKEPKYTDTDDIDELLAQLRSMDPTEPGIRTETGTIIFYAVRLEVLREDHAEASKWINAIYAYLRGNSPDFSQQQPAMVEALDLIAKCERIRTDFKEDNLLFRGNVPVLIDPII